MKPRVLQNSQFPKSLVNLEKFGSKMQAYIQKAQFSNFLINWDKSRSPARVNWEKLGSAA